MMTSQKTFDRQDDNGNREKQESVHRDIQSFRDGKLIPDERYLVPEVEYTVEINGKAAYTMSCSPWDLRDLVYGDLYMKGLIRSGKEVLAAEPDPKKQLISVALSEAPEAEAGSRKEEMRRPRQSRTITAAEVIRLSGALAHVSERFRLTGGVHTAALAKDGELLMVREDVGRHNAMEKLLGACMRQAVDTSDKVIVFSGRVASEILEKAAAVGCSVLIAISAPTSLAVRQAEEKGILLIGFARGDSFNVYTSPERIVSE